MGASPGPWRWDPENPEDGQPYSLFSKGVPYTESGLAIYFEPGGDMTEQDKANLALIRLAPDMASMLRELEWAGFGKALGPWGGVIASCPICDAKSPKYDGNGHAPDCRLSALLAELPK